VGDQLVEACGVEWVSGWDGGGEKEARKGRTKRNSKEKKEVDAISPDQRLIV